MVSGRSSPKAWNLPSNNDDMDDSEGAQQLHHDGQPGVTMFDDDVHRHELYEREKSSKHDASIQNATGESEDIQLDGPSHDDSGAVHTGVALGAGGDYITYEGQADAGGERNDGDAMGDVCEDNNHADRVSGEEHEQLEREDDTKSGSHHVVVGNGSNQNHCPSVGSQDQTYIHQHKQNGLQDEQDFEEQPLKQPQQLGTGDRCLLVGGGGGNSGDYGLCDYVRARNNNADDDNNTGTTALHDGGNDENILAGGPGDHADISNSGEGSNFSAYFNAGGRTAASSISESDADQGSARSSKAGGAHQEGNASDGDDGEEEYDDNGYVEGQGQKREREKRRECFLSMIAGSLQTIGSCFAQANRTIRDVENNQRIMLENENDVGADLVKFGVRIREATELMQRQIFSAFDAPASEVTVVTRPGRGAASRNVTASTSATTVSPTTGPPRALCSSRRRLLDSSIGAARDVVRNKSLTSGHDIHFASNGHGGECQTDGFGDDVMNFSSESAAEEPSSHRPPQQHSEKEERASMSLPTTGGHGHHQPQQRVNDDGGGDKKSDKPDDKGNPSLTEREKEEGRQAKLYGFSMQMEGGDRAVRDGTTTAETLNDSEPWRRLSACSRVGGIDDDNSGSRSAFKRPRWDPKNAGGAEVCGTGGMDERPPVGGNGVGMGQVLTAFGRTASDGDDERSRLAASRWGRT